MIINDLVVDVVDTTTKLGAIWCSAGDVDIKRDKQRLGSCDKEAKISNKRKTNYLCWIERELCLWIVILILFYF